MTVNPPKGKAPPRARLSEGARLLGEAGATLNTIARVMDVSKASVSMWRSGTKKPAAAARAALEREYGIPPRAWDVPAGAQVAPPKAAGKAPATTPDPPAARSSGLGTTMEEVEAQIRDSKIDLEADGLLPSERARLRDTIQKNLALRARLEAAGELLEDRIVREHPAWKRFRARAVEALKPFPDAMRALAAEIERAEDA